MLTQRTLVSCNQIVVDTLGDCNLVNIAVTVRVTDALTSIIYGYRGATMPHQRQTVLVGRHVLIKISEFIVGSLTESQA